MGTKNKNISDDALEEYSLADLEKQARKIEAMESTTQQLSNVTAITNGVQQLNNQSNDNEGTAQTEINAIKGGKYLQYQWLRYNKQSNNSLQTEQHGCLGCGNPLCKRDARCPAKGKIGDGCGICGHTQDQKWI